METNKIQDIEAILSYLKGKDSVKVTDIIENSGAEKLRIYSILFELEQSNDLNVIERGQLGDPVIVTLK